MSQYYRKVPDSTDYAGNDSDNEGPRKGTTATGRHYGSTEQLAETRSEGGTTGQAPAGTTSPSAAHGLHPTMSAPALAAAAEPSGPSIDLLTEPSTRSSSSIGGGPSGSGLDVDAPLWAESLAPADLDELFSHLAPALAPALAQLHLAPELAPALAPDGDADTAGKRSAAGAGGSTGGGEEAEGSEGSDNDSDRGVSSDDPCELHLWAIPLIRDKLVFLPVTSWAEDPDELKQGMKGKLRAMGDGVAGYWRGLKNKEGMRATIHKHGTEILENLTAEERLMHNIPSKASKVIIHHPVCASPVDVDNQLRTMTSSYCAKSLGKAFVAAAVLPVAVVAESFAVPGVGWYAAYCLYKSSAAAAGGQRLKAYLSKPGEIRVCYVPELRLDTYSELAKASPSGCLTEEQVEALADECQESSLLYPMQELRKRFNKRHVAHRTAKARGGDGQGGKYDALPSTMESDTGHEHGGANADDEPPSFPGSDDDKPASGRARRGAYHTVNS